MLLLAILFLHLVKLKAKKKLSDVLSSHSWCGWMGSSYPLPFDPRDENLGVTLLIEQPVPPKARLEAKWSS